MTIDYRIVEEELLSVLASRVRDLIAEGWIPRGGIAVTVRRSWKDSDGYSYNEWTYTQAMTKSERWSSFTDDRLQALSSAIYAEQTRRMQAKSAAGQYPPVDATEHALINSGDMIGAIRMYRNCAAPRSKQ